MIIIIKFYFVDKTYVRSCNVYLLPFFEVWTLSANILKYQNPLREIAMT